MTVIRGSTSSYAFSNRGCWTFTSASARQTLAMSMTKRYFTSLFSMRS